MFPHTQQRDKTFSKDTFKKKCNEKLNNNVIILAIP